MGKPIDRLGGGAGNPWGIAREGDVSRVNIPDDRMQPVPYLSAVRWEIMKLATSRSIRRILDKVYLD